MHINFKYFIVSIGSIFLALGIGILIGSNLGTNEAMEERNASIIEEIDSEFEVLKKKNDQLSKENETYGKSVDSVKSYISNKETILSQNELKDKQVAIISFNEREESTNIETAVKNAGGNIVFSILINESIIDKDAIGKINEKLATNLKTKADVFGLVAGAIKSSNAGGELTKLAELGYVKISGFNGTYDAITNFAVFVNSNSKIANKFAKLEKPMIDKLGLNKPAILVYTTSSDVKDLSKFNDMNMASVNNIDDASGRIAMTILMKDGMTSGNYGNINGDTQLLPIEK